MAGEGKELGEASVAGLDFEYGGKGGGLTCLSMDSCCAECNCDSDVRLRLPVYWWYRRGIVLRIGGLGG